ncbi:AraC family transcriptional regulator [Psychromonas ossibalaenae]|uniref:AraC family transcriptional regulator n=1 Tax=Psychromonas ossibalaenae TaxID=444922 RepID=UPI00036417F3|nr:helix-turn-helix transcriptional regulator [Psychromonas ossibalaenae]
MESFPEVPKVEFRFPDAANPGLEVLDLETLYKRLSQCKHDPSQAHRIKFHSLIYITQGEGAHFIDFHEHQYQPGSFIFVNKNQIHAYDFVNRPQGKLIVVTEEFIDSIHANIRLPFFTPMHLVSSYLPVLTLNPSLRESCEALLHEISKEQNCSNSDNLLVQLLFSALLLKLTRERSADGTRYLSEQRAQKFAQFLVLIEDHYTVTREASAYADMMHITYKSLNQICKLACNQTAKQLIDAHLILQAKRKLIVDSYQIQQLAYQLGFDEVTNFVKFFKRHTLLTPSQFKECFKR